MAAGQAAGCLHTMAVTLSQINDKERVFLLNAPVLSSGLFGDTANSVVDRFQEAKRQAAAFEKCLPCHSQSVRAPPIKKSKSGALPLVPLPRNRKGGWCSRLKSSMEVTDLRTVIFNKRLQGSRFKVNSGFNLQERLQPKGPDSFSLGHLRAGPSGEERYTPQYTVPVSPRCPQEIVPLPLPPSVLQGTAISSEFFFQLPPRNVVVLRGSLPLKVCLEQLYRPPPAGHPLQGTKLVAQSTPEASLERLVPLVHFLAAWKLLPNLSQWVLYTVERGYNIQLGSRPPLFNGVFPTQVGPRQALVME